MEEVDAACGRQMDLEDNVQTLSISNDPCSGLNSCLARHRYLHIEISINTRISIHIHSNLYICIFQSLKSECLEAMRL